MSGIPQQQSSSTSTTTPTSEISAEDAEIEASKRRRRKETYTKALMTNTNLSTVTKFISDFNINLNRYEKEFQMHLETYPDVAEHYHSLTRNTSSEEVVTHKTFMQRYLYRCGDLIRISKELEASSASLSVGAKEKKPATTLWNDDDGAGDLNGIESGSKFGRSNKGTSSAFKPVTTTTTRDSKIRFGGVAGADPKKRSAWTSEEDGQQRSDGMAASATPPMPFRRTRTEDSTDEQQQTQSKVSSMTNSNIKPVLKRPTTPANMLSGDDATHKHRWEDQGKYSPKNVALHKPVRQVSNQTPPPSFAINNSFSGDSDDAPRQQQNTVLSPSKTVSPSIQSKVNAWNKAVAASPGSGSAKLSTTKNPRGVSIPPSIPDIQQGNDPEEREDSNNTQNTTKPSTTKNRIPERHGSAQNLIEKFQSSNKSSVGDTEKNDGYAVKNTCLTDNDDANNNNNNNSIKPISSIRRWKPPIPKNDAGTTNDEADRNENAPQAQQLPLRKVVKKVSINTDHNQTIPARRPSWADSPLIQRGDDETTNKQASSDTSTQDAKRDKNSTSNNNLTFCALPFISFGGGNDTMDQINNVKMKAEEEETDVGFNRMNNEKNASSRWSDYTETKSVKEDKSVSPPRQGRLSNRPSRPRNSDSQSTSTTTPSWVKSRQNENALMADGGQDQKRGDQQAVTASQGNGIYEEPLKTAAEEQQQPRPRRGRPASFRSSSRRSMASSASPSRSGDESKVGEKSESTSEATVGEPSTSSLRSSVRDRLKQWGGKRDKSEKTKSSSFSSSSRRRAANRPSKSASTPSTPDNFNTSEHSMSSQSRSRSGRTRRSRQRSKSPRSAHIGSENSGDGGGSNNTIGTVNGEQKIDGAPSVKKRLSQWEPKDQQAATSTATGAKSVEVSYDGMPGQVRHPPRPTRSSDSLKSQETLDSKGKNTSNHSGGTTSSTRRSKHRSRSPTNSTASKSTLRRSLRASSPGMRQISGGPSVKDRLNNWGSVQETTSMPNRNPPKPTRSNDSLVSSQQSQNILDDTININADCVWKPDPLAVKSVIRADRRRNVEDTYTQVLDLTTLNLGEDEADLDQFLGTFDLASLNDDIAIILAKHKSSVGFHFKRLVPNKVSEEAFWKAYFYRCDERRILRDLRHRENIGTLGQSMVFDTSVDSINEPSFGSALSAAKTRPTKPPVSGEVKPDIKPNQTISEKILKADEKSVMSRGSLINRLQQWNGRVLQASEPERKVPAFIQKVSITAPASEANDDDNASITSFTVTDDLEYLEIDDSAPAAFGIQPTAASEDKSVASRTSVFSRTSVKARLQNWTKIAKGGKEELSNGSKNHAPQRALSVPASSDKIPHHHSAPATPTSPNKPGWKPPVVSGSPTKRFSNRSHLTSSIGDTEKKHGVESPVERTVKPSDVKREILCSLKS